MEINEQEQTGQTAEALTPENHEAGVQDSQGTAAASLEDLLMETPNPEGTPQTEEQVIEAWKEANEYKAGLWKTTDDVYNSVKHYQQKFDPLEKLLEKRGYKEPQELEQVLDLLPQYQKAFGVMEQLNSFMAHPEFGKPLQAAFAELEKMQQMQKYGMPLDSLPQPIQEALAKADEAAEKVKAFENKQYIDNTSQEINNQMTQIGEICKKHGLELNQDEFFEYCKLNEIPPQHIVGQFWQLYSDKLIETAQQKAALGTLGKNKELQQGSIATSTKTEPPQTKEVPKDIGGLQEALMRT